MNAMIAHPKILLLQCGLMYQRVEGKLSSLEPVMLQVCAKSPYLTESYILVKKVSLFIWDISGKRVSGAYCSKNYCSGSRHSACTSFRIPTSTG